MKTRRCSRFTILASAAALLLGTILPWAAMAQPVGPGCTDGDCPSNPGCTDGGCTPDDVSYKAGCCCGEPADTETRICCCKSDMSVTCRETTAVGHFFLDEIRICLGQLPSGKASSTSGPCEGPDKAPSCATANWFPAREHGRWWPKALGCGWMNQLDACETPGDE